MSETATRRQRRPISSNLAPAAQASIGVSVPAMPQPGTGSVGAQDALQTFLEYLRDVDRMKRYRLIGRLSRVQILRPSGAKTLDFRKDGPVLAFATGSEQLIVTDPWRGIPPKWDDTDEFCKACSSDCDVCGATGKKLCEAYKCGGAGRVPLPTVLCPADDCLAGANRQAERSNQGAISAEGPATIPAPKCARCAKALAAPSVDYAAAPESAPPGSWAEAQTIASRRVRNAEDRSLTTVRFRNRSRSLSIPESVR